MVPLKEFQEPYKLKNLYSLCERWPHGWCLLYKIWFLPGHKHYSGNNNLAKTQDTNKEIESNNVEQYIWFTQ